MYNMYVYKIIAHKESLETVESSAEEFQLFLEEAARPDFEKDDVLCVKFAFSIIPDCLDDAEETSWFINTDVISVPPYFMTDSYGARMSCEYPPFLLKIAPNYDGNILSKYDDFDSENYSSDDEKFAAFMSWLGN